MQMQNALGTPSTGGGSGAGISSAPASQAQQFQQQLGAAGAGQGDNSLASGVSEANTRSRREAGDETDSDAMMQEIMKILMQILQMLQQILSGQGDSGSANHGAKAAPDGSIQSVPNDSVGGGGNGTGGTNGTGGSPGAGNIPRPQEHAQTVQLGDKTVTVGGDGTGNASAEEVGATARSIENLYQNSPTFRNMIDNSEHQNLEVSVGRRPDNTSWGGGGRVFMNINNVSPGDSDTFQGLLGHEFAHAAAGLNHGAELDGIQDATAAEA